MARALVWIGFGLLAALWSAAALALGAGLQWAIGFVSSGAAVDMGRAMAEWPLPAWLTWWIDPQAISATLSGIVAMIEAAQRAWPTLESLLGWLVPVAWVLWGLGLAVLLAMAVGAHLLVARFIAPPTPRPA